MKLMHLADLHIGKRVHGFSMLKDQQYILEQVLQLVDQEQPDAVLLAGDIYDKPVPSAEAVSVFDDFLAGLYGKGVCVCLVSGNHDSPERLNFGGRILEHQHIHMAGCYQGDSPMVELRDSYGVVRIWMLPFVRPASLRPYEPEVASYQQAVEAAVTRMKAACEAQGMSWEESRNVLVAHQFVIHQGTLPEVCDSEERSLGTLDQVEASVLDPFDYVALGHLHGPQQVGRPQVRYAGSPLKYSFSERHHKKSVTVVELGEKGQVEIRLLPLRPLHDLRQMQGTMEELVQQGLEQGIEEQDPRQDYLAAVLTDEGQIYDALGRLRAVYPNLMRLEFLRESREFAQAAVRMEQMRSLTAMELFEEFYERQRHQPLSNEGRQVIQNLIEELTRGTGGEEV